MDTIYTELKEAALSEEERELLSFPPGVAPESAFYPAFDELSLMVSRESAYRFWDDVRGRLAAHDKQILSDWARRKAKLLGIDDASMRLALRVVQLDDRDSSPANEGVT